MVIGAQEALNIVMANTNIEQVILLEDLVVEYRRKESIPELKKKKQ